MPKLDSYSLPEIANHYVDLILEQKLAASKSEALAFFMNALAYNVVRESIMDQIRFLKEENFTYAQP